MSFTHLLFPPGHPRFSDGNLGVGNRKIVDPRRLCSHSLSAEQCREGREGKLVARNKTGFGTSYSEAHLSPLAVARMRVICCRSRSGTTDRQPVCRCWQGTSVPPQLPRWPGRTPSLSGSLSTSLLAACLNNPLLSRIATSDHTCVSADARNFYLISRDIMVQFKCFGENPCHPQASKTWSNRPDHLTYLNRRQLIEFVLIKRLSRQHIRSPGN